MKRAHSHFFQDFIRYGAVCVAIVLVTGCAEPLPPEQLADQAIQALEMFDFETAFRLFSQVQPDWPKDDPRWKTITYGKAVAAWHSSPPRQDRVALADELFGEVSARDQNGTLGAWSRLNRARIAEVLDYPGDERDVETAWAIYDYMRTAKVDRTASMMAALRLANLIAFDLSEASALEAIEVLQTQLDQDPDNPFSALAWQYMGDLYSVHLDQTPEALEAYVQAYTIGFSNPLRADEYLWRMAVWADRLEQPERAVEWYRDIVENHPRSRYGTWARQRIQAFAEKTGGISVPKAPNPLSVL